MATGRVAKNLVLAKLSSYYVPKSYILPVYCSLLQYLGKCSVQYMVFTHLTPNLRRQHSIIPKNKGSAGFYIKFSVPLKHTYSIAQFLRKLLIEGLNKLQAHAAVPEGLFMRRRFSVRQYLPLVSKTAREQVVLNLILLGLKPKWSIYLRYFWIRLLLNQLQFTIIANCLFLPALRLKRRISNYKIQHLLDPMLKGAKNLSYPQNLEEDPAHIRTTATESKKQYLCRF